MHWYKKCNEIQRLKRTEGMSAQIKYKVWMELQNK